MKASRPRNFTSKSQFLSVHTKNSTISSSFQNRQVDSSSYASSFQIITYRLEHELEKQKVINRCNLAIQYVPQFELVSQTLYGITIKIKEHPLQLLQWLTKKDALFKVNMVLGIYIAFLQLIDMYGLFSLLPNMMKVNQKQQVAIWINKNFAALQPSQVLPKNELYMSQFTKNFLKIFKCCLPNRPMPEIFNDPKQLIKELTKIKRKQEMHKNCHEFIKYNNKLSNSQRSNKSHSNLPIPNLKSILLAQSHSTNILCNSNFTQNKNKKRLCGLSPLEKQQKKLTSLQKLIQKTELQNKYNLTFNSILMKKKFSYIETQTNRDIKARETKDLSICTTGNLFKRYLLYNTSKNKKINKSVIQNKEINFKNYLDESNQIFSSEDDQFNLKGFDKNNIQERNQAHVVNPILHGVNDEQFSPIKFRKMSSNTNTNERTKKNSSRKTLMKSGGGKTYVEPDNLDFSFQQNDSNFNNETKQKLNNSFPYKTSSTLNSFEQSNQDQHQIFPSNQQLNFTTCSLKSVIPQGQMQEYKKPQEMKIQEDKELESELNKLFQMSNSEVHNQEKNQRMKKIITQFQEFLF